MPKPYNHPVRTAESVAVLDLISGGRVDFGTGRSADPRRARGLRHRSARDPRHVEGGDRARRRLLDERRVRVRRRALADAEAPRAAEADAEAAPAAVGRDVESRRPSPGRRARSRAVLVRRGRAARAGEGAASTSTARASPTAPSPIGAYVHNEAATFTMVLCAPTREEALGERARVVRVVPEEGRAPDRLGRRLDGGDSSRTSATTPTRAT